MNLHAYFQSLNDHYHLLIHWQYHPFGSIHLVQFDEQVYFCMFYLPLLMCIDFWNYHRSLVLVFYKAQSLFCRRLKRKDNRNHSKNGYMFMVSLVVFCGFYLGCFHFVQSRCLCLFFIINFTFFVTKFFITKGPKHLIFFIRIT